MIELNKSVTGVNAPVDELDFITGGYSPVTDGLYSRAVAKLS